MGLVVLQRRSKTVAFFEILDSDEQPFPEPLPWDKHLAEISRELPEARKHVNIHVLLAGLRLGSVTRRVELEVFALFGWS